MNSKTKTLTGILLGTEDKKEQNKIREQARNQIDEYVKNLLYKK